MNILTHLHHLQQLPRLFVACSGGRDSLSLAYACFLLHQQGCLKHLPTLLHVHHGIQKANDDWAIWVTNWAKKHGFVCHVRHLQLDKKSETHARKARYQAMAELMADGDVLLLAHHRDDQAETVLMRLINGSGVGGLSGIKLWQTKQIADKTIVLHRPWLAVSRQDITAFARAHQLKYIDDPTNNTGDNARSFIRTQILPKLHSLNPQASANIARSAVHLQNASSILKDMTKAHLQLCLNTALTHPPHQSAINIDTLGTLSIAQQKQLLHSWLQGDEPLPASTHIIDEIVALCQRTDNDHKTQILWQGQQCYVVCRYQNTLYRYTQAAFETLSSPCHAISQPSTHVFLLKQHTQNLVWHAPQSVNISIHALTPQQKLTIFHHRHALSGKKLCQNLKIAPWLRHNLWVVSQDGVPVLLIAPYQSWTLQSPLENAYQNTQGASWQLLHQKN